MIEIIESRRTFHLQTRHTSLILHVLDSGHMVCLYWGGRVLDHSFSYIVKEIKRASYLSDTDGIKDFKLEQQPLTYPAYGNPDMRTPAFMFEYEDGSRITDLRYQSCKSYKGKRKLEGLPTVVSEECQVLELTLRDVAMKVEVVLTFAVFEEWDAITESVAVKNIGTKVIQIERLMSSCYSFLDCNFDLVTLTGAWGRECHFSRQPIRQGMFVLDSKRSASGHGQNPFLALAEPSADEEHGNVYSMNFVYSGNFEAGVEIDMHQNTRLMMGLNAFDFNWKLEADEVFQSPEVVMVHTKAGFGEMSRIYHRLYRDCLIQSKYAKQVRPVLFNSWEAAYFDFDKERLLVLAKEAANLGVELFVLDDGWYGKRNSEKGSLGDWIPNEKKMGGSLNELAKQVNALGMQFGLWFEPEMVSKDSRLYESHPEWIIRVKDHEPQLARYQYVLDLSRREVQDYIINAVSKVLDSANISYVKWDMNRNITDLGSFALPNDRQKEVSHRYMLGLYRILEVLTRRYPDVLWEGCAGGGGRFDAGILYYMPQIWTSDDTDAIERLDIQFGTSYVYPAIAMGCHVSESPNHQVGRKTSLGTRGLVAMQGNLGYEIDLLKTTNEEKTAIKRQIAAYKEMRHTIQNGTLYRLVHSENERAWMYCSEDGSRAYVSYVQILAKPNTVPKRLKLQGLQQGIHYIVDNGKETREGSALMEIGLALPKVSEDFYARQWQLTREE
ncbi:MAG: alpha-galactosidase [bacterium]|nr:alpha-galactosidase [bacterium]